MSQDNENSFNISSGPYDPPPDDLCIDVPQNPSSARITFFSSPQPNMLMAFVWTLGLMFIQAFVGGVVGVGLILVGFIAFGQEVFSDEQMPDWIMNILLPVGTLTTLASALAVAALYYRRQIRRRIAWRWCSWTQLVLVVLSVIPLATIASEVVNWAGEYLPHLSAKLFAEFSHQPFLLIFIAACLLPGLGEEIFFRGFMHHGLSKRHGPILTILITSFLFGIMHIDPVQSCGAAFLGLWLHYLVWHTKSLAAPIMLHFLNNTLAFALMRFADQLPVPGLNYVEEGTVAHIPALLLLAAFAAVIPIAFGIWQCRTYWVLPDETRWISGLDDPDVPDPSLHAKASQDGVRKSTWLAIAVTYGLFIMAVLAASQSA